MTAVGNGIGITRIGQIAFTVSDVARAVAFYRDVVGLHFLFEAPPNLAFFECGGTRLMLAPPERDGAFAGQQFNSILYYTVADIQAAASALTGRGVQFDEPPHVVARLAAADLWIGVFRDPDGHVLALMSEVPRA